VSVITKVTQNQVKKSQKEKEKKEKKTKKKSFSTDFITFKILLSPQNSFTVLCSNFNLMLCIH